MAPFETPGAIVCFMQTAQRSDRGGLGEIRAELCADHSMLASRRSSFPRM